MCSHCLFPVADKSGTTCYHLVTRLTRPTDSQQVVPTSLISSARNMLLTSWWQHARSNLLRTACISRVGTTCSNYRHQPCNKVITTCCRLVTTTGNKQCEHILISAWQQPCFYVCDVTLSVHPHRASWNVCLTTVGIEPATFGILVQVGHRV
jgi:hypothetical protein